MNQSVKLSAGLRASGTKPLVVEGDIARISALAVFALISYLVLAVMRFQEYTWIDFDAPIIPVIEVTMMAAWFLSPKPPGLAHVLPVVLLGIVYFVASLSVDTAYSLDVTTNYFLNIGFVYIVLAQVAVDPRRADLVMAAFGSCMAVISLQCILMALDPGHMGWTGLQAIERLDSVPRVWQVRYIGTMEDPNDLGMTMLAALPMLAFLASTSRSRLLQGYFLICLGACIYAIYLLNSRGTVLGLVAMIALIGLYRVGVAKAVMLGAICLPVAIVLAPSRLGDLTLDRSALDRIDSWYNGLKMFTSNPLFGVGKDQYLTHHYKVSHNSWIEQVAEFGIIGYLLWNRIVLGAMVEVWQLVRADRRLEAEAAAEQAALPAQSSSNRARRSGALKNRTVALPAPVDAGLPVIQGAGAPTQPRPVKRLRKSDRLTPEQQLDSKRSMALFYSIAGVLVAIFFIDRSDSLITFLVCALIAGSLTRYRLTRPDVHWLPVSLWVYLGAFIALVLVYFAIYTYSFS